MNWIKNIFYLFYLILITFVILEIIFRFLPVSESYGSTVTNYNKPVMHFKKNSIVQRQTGFDFNHVVTKKTNNYGFFTDIEFKRNEKNIVIIGDSFVEASQVENEFSFHGLLNSATSNQKFYPIAVSGAPLSQYLLYAEFASVQFNETAGYIIVIIANDFDESWLKYKNTPGFQHFDIEGNLQFSDYEESKIRKILSKSAFIRYLFLDLKIFYQLGEILNRKNEEEDQPELIKKKLDAKEINKEKEIFSKKAAIIFIEELKKIVKDKPVLLLLDADKDSIYLGKKDRNFDDYRQVAMSYLIQNKKYKNFFILDLQKTFHENWIKEKKRFDYEYDGHWSKHGHQIVFESLKNSIFYKNINN